MLLKMKIKKEIVYKCVINHLETSLNNNEDRFFCVSEFTLKKICKNSPQYRGERLTEVKNKKEKYCNLALDPKDFFPNFEATIYTITLK